MQKRILRTMLLTALAIVMVLGLSSAALAKFSDWTDMSIQVTAPYGISLTDVASISSGFADNTWKPYQTITRAQFTKMVVDKFKITLKNPATPSFSDVPATSTFYPYIEGAKAAGAINGKTATTFAPGDPITRQQAIAIISRYFVQDNKQELQWDIGYDTGTDCDYPWAGYKWGLNVFWSTLDAAALLEDAYADAASIAPTFNKELLFAKMSGLAKGDIDNNVKPLANMTRIQAAAIIIRGEGGDFDDELWAPIYDNGPAEEAWLWAEGAYIDVCEKVKPGDPFHAKTNPYTWKWRWTATATQSQIGSCEIDVTVEGPKAGKTATGKAEMLEAVPNTDPKTYVVDSIELTDAGKGYTAADVGQKVTVAPPTGFVEATAVARVVDNKVVGIDVTSYGSGYKKTTNEELLGEAEIAKPGSGTQAKANVYIQDGSVTRIEVTNAGTGYLSAPEVTLPTGGVVAEFTIATLGAEGKIATLTKVHEGIGYGKTPPAVTFPEPIKKAAEIKATAVNGAITGFVFKKDKDGADIVGAGYMTGETPKVIFPEPTGQGKEMARANANVSGHQIATFTIHDAGYGYYCDGKVSSSTTLKAEVRDRDFDMAEGYKVEFELLGTPNSLDNGIYTPKAFLRDPAYDFNGDEAGVEGKTAVGYTLKTKMAEVTINLDVDKAAHLKGRGAGNVQNQINVKVYDPNGVLLWEQVATLIWDVSDFDS